MDKKNNIRIAEDTLRIIENNRYGKDGRETFLDTDAPLCGVCYDKVKVFSPDDLQAIRRDDDELFERAFYASRSCTFTLVNADSFEAVRDLSHGLVMNFANAKYPGGGFLNGATAQEESLCRCSTLYASLSSKKAKAMYEYNKKANLPCYSDYMLLSPNVIVFRKPNGEYLEKPFYTSVMTVAAPNRKGAARTVPVDEVDRVMKERLNYFLKAAAHEGYRELVLGAWGCGAFGNDPHHVARCFYELFFDDGLRDFFDHIVFAIYGGGANYDAFEEVFADVLDFDDGEPESTEPLFTEANQNAPVCNHSPQDVNDENLGYTFGVLADGTPFEGNLWLDGNERNISFYVPENRNFIPKTKEKSEASKQLPYTTEYACHWNSVLSIGMVERETESDTEELMTYVDYLTENGLIRFTTKVQNGRLSFLTDVEGNDLVCVSIALDEDGEERAKTPLRFRPFPNQPENKRKALLRMIEARRNSEANDSE